MFVLIWVNLVPCKVREHKMNKIRMKAQISHLSLGIDCHRDALRYLTQPLLLLLRNMSAQQPWLMFRWHSVAAQSIPASTGSKTADPDPLIPQKCSETYLPTFQYLACTWLLVCCLLFRPEDVFVCLQSALFPQQYLIKDYTSFPNLAPQQQHGINLWWLFPAQTDVCLLLQEGNGDWEELFRKRKKARVSFSEGTHEAVRGESEQGVCGWRQGSMITPYSFWCTSWAPMGQCSCSGARPIGENSGLHRDFFLCFLPFFFFRFCFIFFSLLHSKEKRFAHLVITDGDVNYRARPQTGFISWPINL